MTGSSLVDRALLVACYFVIGAYVVALLEVVLADAASRREIAYTPYSTARKGILLPFWPVLLVALIAGYLVGLALAIAQKLKAESRARRGR